MGLIILTGISHGRHKFSLEYPMVDGESMSIACCKCG